MTDTSRGLSYRFGECELHPHERRLIVSGKIVEVGPRAFDVLLVLVERAGQLVTKGELLERVWPRLVVEENNVQVQVSALRKLLGVDAIATIPGMGYRFTPPIEPSVISGTSPVPSRPSLAVLPFVNIGGDPEQEYFADGLTEDLITDISRFTRMSVAGREAVFAYKGGNRDIARIARELGVRHVLEGSIRRSGSRVRLNAQLVDAQSGRPLWAQRFDRDLQDLFEVQDEMTRAIVAELEIQILEGEQARSWQRGTDNPVALDLFRRCRAAGVPMTLRGFLEGLAYLQQAVAIDPSYARAKAGIAATGMAALMYGLSSGQKELLDKSGKAADEALALDPEMAEGWIAKGQHLVYEGRGEEADAAARRALTLGPNANIVQTGAARIYLFTGRTEAAIDLAREVALKKRNTPSRHPALVIGVGSVLLGRYDEARSIVEPQLGIVPDNPIARLILAAAHAGLGNAGEARAQGRDFKRLLQHEAFAPLTAWMLPFVDAASRDRVAALLREAGVD